MSSSAVSGVPGIMLIIVGAVIALPLGVVAIIYLIVPLFRAIGFFFKQLFGFVGSTIADTFRVLGALITSVVLCFLVLGNIVVGRWSASAHFGRAVQSEFATAGHCLYRLVIGNPARALCLTALTEGIEKRIPQVVAAAPGPDQPKGGRLNQFDGYTIVGSLAGGGSGGRLYIAEPDNRKKAAFAKDGQADVEQVVIKTFSLKEGSTLPQIVRENRALDAAKRLGLILEHDLTPERFYYAMRYVPGENLSLVTQRLHAAAGPAGLDRRQLADVLGYMTDLMSTLRTYHEGGLWHKDVKPDNIIVARGAAHLVDFGLVTPLRSAMTLTTHGTEYFRDPEMVRMALRGVKVHEVDGAKFDVYAAGAVLFSMIENSFPAHGGLSQLSKSCPEALRWIVRRAMTDYEKRYPTARAMLADLAVVASAADPFAVKLAQLPSVAGADPDVEIPAAAPSPAAGQAQEPGVFVAGFPRAEVKAAAAAAGAPAANVYHAQDAHGARGRMRDFFAGVGGKIDDAMAKAGFAPATPTNPPTPPVPPVPPVPPMYGGPGIGPRPRSRPNLRIRSWWSGAYDVIDANAPQPGPVYRAAAYASPAVPSARRPMPSGIPAAEQLRRARERADAARARVSARLGRPAPSRNYASGINAGVAVAVLLFVGVSAALIASGMYVLRAEPVRVLGGSVHQQPAPHPVAFDLPHDLAAFADMFSMAFAGFSDDFRDAFVDAFEEASGAAPEPVDPDEVNADFPASLFVLRDPISLESPARERVTETLTRLHNMGIALFGTVDPSLAGAATEDADALSAQLRAKIALAPPKSIEAVQAIAAWLGANPGVDGVLWAYRGDNNDLAWRIIPSPVSIARRASQRDADEHPQPPSPPRTAGPATTPGPNRSPGSILGIPSGPR
jgi:serine/threonine protein kinase